MSYWEDVAHHAPTDLFWMTHPLVRRRIGAFVTGDPKKGYPLDWFMDRLQDRLPFARMLSVGCGTGPAERHLALAGAARQITGIDMSTPALEEARKAAAAAGLGERVTYETADAHAYLKSHGPWDAILFHQSLHHLDRLRELFGLVEAALVPDGILFFDEYIGPSRDEWSWGRMLIPNLVYATLPLALRRTKIVRPPVTDDDPTEMLRSSQIAPIVRERFDIVEWRDYGGNLVILIYPSLRQPAPGDDAARARFDRALERLFRLEDRLLEFQASFHAVVIARKGGR
jgi:SAM-dependent methyltransferase